MKKGPLSFKLFLAFSTHLSEGVYFTLLAYYFAAASISHSFSPGILFNFSSDKNYQYQQGNEGDQTYHVPNILVQKEILLATTAAQHCLSENISGCFCVNISSC